MSIRITNATNICRLCGIKDLTCELRPSTQCVSLMPICNPCWAKERYRLWHRRNAPSHRANATRWVKDHPEWHQATTQATRRSLKLEALNAYGGPRCQKCGSTDFEKLSLDHINGDGAAHRQQLGLPPRRAGDIFYRAIRALGWPTDPPLQVLCGACNTGKGNAERA